MLVIFNLNRKCSSYFAGAKNARHLISEQKLLKEQVGKEYTRKKQSFQFLYGRLKCEHILIESPVWCI